MNTLNDVVFVALLVAAIFSWPSFFLRRVVPLRSNSGSAA
jgi:hypothetical protein